MTYRTKKKIAVVTPTYNRVGLLKYCYESLINQTSKDFVWLIIDDGSTDKTETNVLEWKSEKKIKIEYFKKANGGKASALNMALDLAESQYFVCLDSDDTFSKDAIEKALAQLSVIDENNHYAGVLALRTRPDGVVLGGKQIPNDVSEVNLPKINQLKINSELIIFYKTNIINKYRFPEIKGEKFISPAYIEYEIGRKYSFLPSRETYCYCEYMEDGLTKNKKKIIKKNPKGYSIVKRQSFELTEGFFHKCKHGAMYIAGSILSSNRNFIKESPNKFLTIMLFPFGWVISRTHFR